MGCCCCCCFCFCTSLMTLKLAALLNHFLSFHQPCIRPSTYDHDCQCKLPPCYLRMGGRGPTQADGLNLGHRKTLAPLRANDLWIGFLCARHPVQPHRQLPGHRHLGHAVVLPGLQSCVHTAQILVSPGGTGCPFHQEIS